MPQVLVLNKDVHSRTPDFEEIDHTLMNRQETNYLFSQTLLSSARL